MSTTPPSVSINYASLLGIQSLAAAVVFTILFAPFALLFLWRTISRFNSVHVFLTIFCLVRVVAFAMRAALAGSSSMAGNLDLLIADLVLFGVGFTGLLFSTSSLQADRERIAGLRYENTILAVITNQRAIHLVIVAAVALSITGTIKLFSDSADSRDLGNTLRTAGTWVIFALTLIVLFRAALFIRYEMSGNQGAVKKQHSFSDKYASAIIGIIAVLLFIRMIYTVVTVRKGQNEATWYPLSTLPEFLCVCVFAIPGLVLSQSELAEKDLKMNGYHDQRVVAPTVV